MPEERPADDIEKFLLEEKAVEDRKQALIDDLLRQRAEAIKAFDEKLAKLGHKSSAGKQEEATTSSLPRTPRRPRRANRRPNDPNLLKNHLRDPAPALACRCQI